MESQPSPWPVQHTLMEVSNPWLKLIGERLLTPDQTLVDYWRVEKADSVILLPLWRGQVVVPPAMYRPGVGAVTLDLPGGRVPAPHKPQEAALEILHRELGVTAAAIATLTPLNAAGWPVNSSFSNQRLFGLRAELHPEATPAWPADSRWIPWTAAGLTDLLEQITCLQCRTVLLEGWRQHPGGGD